MGEEAALEPSSEYSPSKCGWSGPLPGFKQPVLCQACDKLRTAGEVTRCQRNGGPQIEGAGDLLAMATKATGIDKAVQAIVGDCGCKSRQDWLNKAIPFTQEPQDAGQSLPFAESVPENASPNTPEL